MMAITLFGLFFILPVLSGYIGAQETKNYGGINDYVGSSAGKSQNIQPQRSLLPPLHFMPWAFLPSWGTNPTQQLR
jgi:hypothetical protein